MIDIYDTGPEETGNGNFCLFLILVSILCIIVVLIVRLGAMLGII